MNRCKAGEASRLEFCHDVSGVETRPESLFGLARASFLMAAQKEER